MPDTLNESPSLTVSIDTQLCFALHSASNVIEQLYRPLLDQFDLTYPQYIVLMALAEKDNVSITRLAARLSVSKATMTPLLRRLESKGMIHRQVNPNNERQKSVQISDQGRSVFEVASDTSHQVFCNSGLTKEEADELVRLSKIITTRS